MVEPLFVAKVFFFPEKEAKSACPASQKTQGVWGGVPQEKNPVQRYSNRSEKQKKKKG
jgi:hypothetical protein